MLLPYQPTCLGAIAFRLGRDHAYMNNLLRHYGAQTTKGENLRKQNILELVQLHSQNLGIDHA
jgi:hypothetical protein